MNVKEIEYKMSKERFDLWNKLLKLGDYEYLKEGYFDKWFNTGIDKLYAPAGHIHKGSLYINVKLVPNNKKIKLETKSYTNTGRINWFSEYKSCIAINKEDLESFLSEKKPVYKLLKNELSELVFVFNYEKYDDEDVIVLSLNPVNELKDIVGKIDFKETEKGFLFKDLLGNKIDTIEVEILPEIKVVAKDKKGKDIVLNKNNLKKFFNENEIDNIYLKDAICETKYGNILIQKNKSIILANFILELANEENKGYMTEIYFHNIVKNESRIKNEYKDILDYYLNNKKSYEFELTDEIKNMSLEQYLNLGGCYEHLISIINSYYNDICEKNEPFFEYTKLNNVIESYINMYKAMKENNFKDSEIKDFIENLNVMFDEVRNEKIKEYKENKNNNIWRRKEFIGDEDTKYVKYTFLNGSTSREFEASYDIESLKKIKDDIEIEKVKEMITYNIFKVNKHAFSIDRFINYIEFRNLFKEDLGEFEFYDEMKRFNHKEYKLRDELATKYESHYGSERNGVYNGYKVFKSIDFYNALKSLEIRRRYNDSPLSYYKLIKKEIVVYKLFNDNDNPKDSDNNLCDMVLEGEKITKISSKKALKDKDYKKIIAWAEDFKLDYEYVSDLLSKKSENKKIEPINPESEIESNLVSLFSGLDESKKELYKNYIKDNGDKIISYLIKGLN